MNSWARIAIISSMFAAVACGGCESCEEPPAPDVAVAPEPDMRSVEDEPEVDTLAVATELAEASAEKSGVRMGDTARAVAGEIEALAKSKPAPPSKPKLKDEPETGTLQKAALNKVFNMHADAMKSCYERALKRSPGLSGKVRLELLISSDGSVRSANARALSLRDDTVTNCMERQAKTMKFPDPDGGAVRVNKSFSFTPDF